MVCLNTKRRLSDFHSRREETTSSVLVPTLASLALLLNLTVHVDGDKGSAGITDSGMRLQGHCRTVVSSGCSGAGRQRACGMDIFQ